MPWRGTKDPYKVWLSEIILQQTRVEQGLPYYEKFIAAYPTIQELANAPGQEVLRLWQGLGYYSRARNLHATAKLISNEYDGDFPSTYKDVLRLKGIGPYTAAAITSFCFDKSKPVVDGNVFRFASRMFGMADDIAKAKTRKVFESLLSDHIKNADPANFNQAMMEFGATVCSPSPKCTKCPFKSECVAHKENNQLELPVKTKKTKVRERHFHYLVFEHGHQFIMNERNGKDIWPGLFDFPLLEGQNQEEDVLKQIDNEFTTQFTFKESSSPIQHILSHQRIIATFYRLEVNRSIMKKLEKKLGLLAYSNKEILNLPKPKLIVNYFHQIHIKY